MLLRPGQHEAPLPRICRQTHRLREVVPDVVGTSSDWPSRPRADASHTPIVRPGDRPEPGCETRSPERRLYGGSQCRTATRCRSGPSLAQTFGLLTASQQIGRNRDLDDEASATHAALGPNAPAVRFDDAAANREAQAGPGDRGRTV